MQKLSSDKSVRSGSHRRGAMMMLIVLCIPVVLAFSAYAVNVAWMQLTRTELRAATDAAARASSRTLSLSQNPTIARAAGIDAASRNKVAGDGLLLAATDVQFGYSAETPGGTWSFSPRADDATDLSGVRVTGDRRAGSAAGPVPMLFTGLFDRTTFEPVKTVTATHIDRDVYVVLDRSGSMGTATPTGTRWTDLKEAVLEFLNTIKNTPQDEIVGIVSYASTASLDENMTLNYGRLVSTINTLSTDGSTAIGLGLEEAIGGIRDPSYARPNAAKTIVLMTDGIHNTGIDPVLAAQNAQDTYGITVHTVTFGAGAEQQHMQNVATAGGGNHWHADDQAQLIQAFVEIANNLPTLITE